MSKPPKTNKPPESSPPRAASDPVPPSGSFRGSIPRTALLVTTYAFVLVAYGWRPGQSDGSAAQDALRWVAFMVRTFTPHLGLGLVVLAVIAVWKKRWALLCATLPLALFANGETIRDFWPKSPPPFAGESLRIMSVNLLYGNHRNAEEILRQIQEQAPDVLALQEYTTRWHAALFPSLSSDLPHSTWQIRDRDAFGAAVYSKFPIVGQPELNLRLAEHDACQMRVVLSVQNRDIALYNVHLMPPAGRTKLRLQEEQFAGLLEIVRDDSLPVLLCGDFNFTVHNVFHGELTELGLQDTHQLAGRGRAATWPALSSLRWLPGVRIDHIYLGSQFTCVGHQVGRPIGSDHLPIVADIGFRESHGGTKDESP